MNDPHDAIDAPDTPAENPGARIRAFVLSNFYVPDAAGLSDDTSLMETGVVDSTGILEVIEFLGREFGVRVDDAEVTPENLDSFGRLARFVTRKLGEGQGRS